MAHTTPRVRVSVPLVGALVVIVLGLVASWVYWQQKEDSVDTSVETPTSSLKAATPLPEQAVPTTIGAATFTSRNIEDTTCSDPNTIAIWDQTQGVSAVSVPKKAPDDDQELSQARDAVGNYIHRASEGVLTELGIPNDVDYKLRDVSLLPNVAFAISCFGINALEVRTIDDLNVGKAASRVVVVAEESGALENVVDGNRVVYLFVEDGDRYYMVRRAVYSSKDWEDRITAYAESCEGEDSSSEVVSGCVSDKIDKDQELATRLRSAAEQLVKDYPAVKAAVLKK